jgi:hypothetical protein
LQHAAFSRARDFLLAHDDELLFGECFLLRDFLEDL